jgi:hypothetical protein
MMPASLASRARVLQQLSNHLNVHPSRQSLSRERWGMHLFVAFVPHAPCRAWSPERAPQYRRADEAPSPSNGSRGLGFARAFRTSLEVDFALAARERSRLLFLHGSVVLNLTGVALLS